MKYAADSPTTKRKFLKSFLTLPFITAPAFGAKAPLQKNQPVVAQTNPRLKISLNAYSFNEPLSKGEMTIEDLLKFCAAKNLAAVDITAYYFPGYPLVPPDAFLYDVKRMAFRLGVEISGTGVRNDFTEADPVKRKSSVGLVKNWIDAAEKLGAPVIRIFSGTQKPAGYSRGQVLAWMLADIRECTEYGKAHGVVVAIQNHDDFVKTADEAIEILEAINSEWFGLILDTGSYRTADPYDEISRTTKYAVSWQIKEKIYVNGQEVDVDLHKLFAIIKASGYTGYLPIETLGKGDPEQKLSVFLEKINTVLQP
jgi:sugar phosphate isomerase/epimerase